MQTCTCSCAVCGNQSVSINEKRISGTYPGMRLFSLCRRRNTLHVDGIVRHALVAPEEPLPGLGVVVVLRGKHLCADLYGVAVGQGVACLGRDGKVAHAAFVEHSLNVMSQPAALVSSRPTFLPFSLAAMGLAVVVVVVVVVV